MTIVLACDLGGASFRAALIDETGAARAAAARPSPVPERRGEASEIDPPLWRAALFALAGDLARAAPQAFAAIEGVALCGATRTQVFLEADGRPLRPAMLWDDARAEGAARRLAARAPGHPEAAALNAFHPAARLAFLAETEPERLARLACVLDPKDYLAADLTGERASDPVSLARLIAAATPDAAGVDLLAALGASPALLPPLREPWERTGDIRSGLPAPFDRLAGVPVFCGSNDTYAAVLGLGAMRAGVAYNISGTTEVLGVVGPEPMRAEGLLTVDWRGLWQLGGPSQTGADALAWLAAILGREVGALEALLAARRDPQPALFLPYLSGERVPHWDAGLRGAFVGLSRRHGPADLVWAALEGVAFQNRLVLERAEARTGAVHEIRFGGGGAANARWRQIKADVCGRPIVTGAAKEPGLVGAAILAFVGLGRFASLAAAQDAMVRIAQRCEPDPARAAIYDALYARWREAEAAIAPVSRALAGFDAATLVAPAATEHAA
ncbi:MAG: carbohydrate kinase [Methylobacteriaceae bacterium]|nr:carbohydrate kinase [Methylobacteriaceae bacterium]